MVSRSSFNHFHEYFQFDFLRFGNTIYCRQRSSACRESKTLCVMPSRELVRNKKQSSVEPIPKRYGFWYTTLVSVLVTVRILSPFISFDLMSVIYVIYELPCIIYMYHNILVYTYKLLILVLVIILGYVSILVLIFRHVSVWEWRFNTKFLAPSTILQLLKISANCDYWRWGSGGRQESINAICILALNIINDKVKRKSTK